MILHFVIDEKVTDQIIENFSVNNTNFYFLVFVKSKSEEYNFISVKSKALIKFNQATDNINEIIDCIKPKSILVHAFHLEFALVINKIENLPKIAWYPWGFDIYGLPNIKPYTYAPLTNKNLLKKKPYLRFARIFLKYKLIRKIYCFVFDKVDRYSIIFQAIKKTDFLVTYLKGDYNLLIENYNFKLKFIYCPLSTLNQYLSGNNNIQLDDTASNIMVGNSNSWESNHLDVFQILKQHSSSNINLKIIVPLSYGNANSYREMIVNKGKLLFGTQFLPLLNFMPRADYIKIMVSCSTGIFYHYRQQAMGNIIAMLYLGCRIYLSDKNPSYNFFLENGIEVFDLKKDYKVYKNNNLNQSAIRRNQDALFSLFSKERVLEDVQILVSTIS